MRGVSKFEKWVAVVIFTVWAATILVLGIGKIVMDGMERYLVHFTNWSWTLNGALFVLDLLSLTDGSGYYTFCIVSMFFWLVNGVSWSVFWLIFIVLYENPDLLITMSNRGTGDQPLGFIMDMDRVFHVLPALMTLLYMFLRRDKLAFISHFYLSKINSIHVRFFYGLASMISPAVVALMYFSTNDVNEVYGITANIGWIFGTALLSLIVFNLIPFMIFYVKYANPKHVTRKVADYVEFIAIGSRWDYTENDKLRRSNPFDNNMT